MFFVPKQCMYQVADCKIESITISDHAPIILTLNLGIEKCFKYWRANISLLNDPAVTKEMKECINEYLNINDKGDVSQSVLWDSAKATIRGKMIEISSRIK